MPPALSQGDRVQIRGHAENCPQPYLPVRPFTTASSPARHLPAQQRYSGASGQSQTTGTDQQPPQQQKKARRIRVPEEWCHTGREESSSSALVWMCSFLPSATQGEASRTVGKQLSTEELQPSGNSASVSCRPGEPRTKEDHARSETYSQIPAKSHYRVD